MISNYYQIFIHNLFLMINLQTRPAHDWYDFLFCVKIKDCEQFFKKISSFDEFNGIFIMLR